jgi:hypothetical protein
VAVSVVGMVHFVKTIGTSVLAIHVVLACAASPHQTDQWLSIAIIVHAMFADGEGITVLTISMNVNRTHVETARLVTILPQILRSLLMRSNADVQLAGWVQFAQWTLMSAILYRA